MRVLTICLLSAFLLAACGLKGPLYLPEENGKEKDKQEQEE